MLEDQYLTHKWYAYDGNVVGSFESLRIVLNKLYDHRGAFGYIVIRCYLITQPEFVNKGTTFFRN